MPGISWSMEFAAPRDTYILTYSQQTTTRYFYSTIYELESLNSPGKETGEFSLNVEIMCNSMMH
jgi:hypothetical protein